MCIYVCGYLIGGVVEKRLGIPARQDAEQSWDIRSPRQPEADALGLPMIKLKFVA